MSLRRILLGATSAAFLGGAAKKPIPPTEYIFAHKVDAKYGVEFARTEKVDEYYEVAQSEEPGATSWNPQRKIARLSDGTLYVVYHKKLAGNYQIYVKKSVDGGETWTDETRISTAGGMENYPQRYASIAVDGNGNLHVVWNGRATGYTIYIQVWYNYYDGAWHTPIRISILSGMEEYDQPRPSIAVDENNYLHVAWAGCSSSYPTYNQLWYREYTVTWQPIVRISTAEGMENYPHAHPSIAIDSLNNPHVVWHGKATGYTKSQIWHNYYDGTWDTPTRISTYSGMEDYDQDSPCIAVDSEDNLLVVWDGNVASYPIADQVWYNYYDGTWHTPTRLSIYPGMDIRYQYYASIGVDSEGIHVLWHGKADGYTDYDKVWYARYVTGWATPEVLQPTGQNQNPILRWSRWP